MRHLLASLAVKPTRALQATYTHSCYTQLSYFLFTHSLVSRPLNLKIQPMGPWACILCYGLHAVFDLSSSCQFCFRPPNSAPSGVLCTPILHSWHELVKGNTSGGMFSKDRNLSDLEANRKGCRKPYAPHGSPSEWEGLGVLLPGAQLSRDLFAPHRGIRSFFFVSHLLSEGERRGKRMCFSHYGYKTRGPCLPSPCPRERCSKRRPHTCLHFN